MKNCITRRFYFFLHAYNFFILESNAKRYTTRYPHRIHIYQDSLNLEYLACELFIQENSVNRSTTETSEREESLRGRGQRGGGKNARQKIRDRMVTAENYFLKL